MNLKVIINSLPFVGVLVMVLWGVLGNAWNISWIAVCAAGILMGLLSAVNANLNKNKKSDENTNTEQEKTE